MSDLLYDIIAWFDHHESWAYVGIFVLLVVSGTGLPIAEELVTLAAGALIQQGVIELLPAWLLCYTGIIIADCMVVWIGRHFGKAVLHRRWVKRILHPRRVLQAHHHVHEHGVWVIVVSRFVPGSRWATLLIAGMAHLPRWKVILADGASAIVTVSIQIAAGYYLAALAASGMNVQEWLMVGGLVLGVTLIGGYILWYRSRSSQADRPRAKLRRFSHLRRRRRNSSTP